VIHWQAAKFVKENQNHLAKERRGQNQHFSKFGGFKHGFSNGSIVQ
jgi:hypothetical protein